MIPEKYSLRELSSWLPLYVNGRLEADKRQILESWLADDPQAQIELESWRQLGDAILRQPRLAPSRQVWVGLSQHIQAGKLSAHRRWTGVAAGVLLWALSLVVLWLVVRPGVALEWSVSQPAAATYRIFRAPEDGGEFVLVKEFAGQPGVSQFRYLDMLYFPGRSYLYRIEAVHQGRTLVSSQPVLSHTLAALPGQIAILVSSLLLGLLAAWIVQIRGQTHTARWQASG